MIILSLKQKIKQKKGADKLVATLKKGGSIHVARASKNRELKGYIFDLQKRGMKIEKIKEGRRIVEYRLAPGQQLSLF